MKNLLLFAFFASASLLVKAQNDLVVFSEQGEKFFVVIDGVRQNAKSETNVKVTGLRQPMVTAKVIFDGTASPDIDQKIYFMWEGEQKQGWEFTYAVLKKGDVYKIKPRSGAAIMQAPPPPGQTVIVYSTTPPPVTEVTTTTISSTTTSGTPTGDNVNVNMNVGGVGLNMNVNVNDGNTHSGSTSMSSTTTTTSSTTSSGFSGDQPTPHPSDPIYLPGYTGPVGCPMPMQPMDFESAKKSIESKSFEDSKLTIAKQIIGSNCLLSSQVKEIMMLFSFENTRLDLAKFAYGKTYDRGNYYKLNDAFEFESSIDALSKYTGSYK